MKPRSQPQEEAVSVVGDDTVSTVRARDNFSELIHRAAVDKERIVLTRRGKPVAAVVPIEDVQLLETLEDRLDAADAQAALEAWRAEGCPSVSLDEVLADYGLSRDDLGE
jgi:prevent-host-death family protein